MADRIPRSPVPPTPMGTRFADGRVYAANRGSMMLYRRIPLGPCRDAKTDEDGAKLALPIMAAFRELSALAGSARIERRRLARSSYRSVHILLVNTPRSFEPPVGHPLGARLRSEFAQTIVDRRTALFGVALRPGLGGGSLRSFVDSQVETWLSGGTPVSDFDKDFALVDAALTRAGLTRAEDDDFDLASRWWNQGSFSGTPYMPDGDHLHFFTSASSTVSAAELMEDKVPCDRWPSLPNHHEVSFATVSRFGLSGVRGDSQDAHWVGRLVDSGAVVVSVRALVEPPNLTRATLRQHRGRYVRDLQERQSEGKMDRAEQDQLLADLATAESHYSSDGASPTLVDTSVIVGLSGRDEQNGFDPSEIGKSAGVVLDPMLWSQEAAFFETMPCSVIRANPHLHDFPTPVIAFSGLPSLAIVGDRTGALVGFTELDRQPAYMDDTAAAGADTLPLGVVVGQTGSGKTMLMLRLAEQWARMRNRAGELKPVIVIDPKQGSDHSEAAARVGAQVFSLDELSESDGVFDPIRFSASRTSGVQTAHSLLMTVNPWGTRRLDFETPLLQALAYGVEKGATCTGQALEIAAQERVNEYAGAILEGVKAQSSSPTFRALCGFDPVGTGLRVSEGLTYIRVGTADFELPDENVPASQVDRITQRTCLALVRAMVYGSSQALMGRQGVLLMDEGWVFLSSGRADCERLGRLARSQDFFPVFFTQRVTDLTNAGLAGFISRGVILPITDPAEARAALELFRVEVTQERMDRIRGGATIGGDDRVDGSPNWSSMRALRDPVTREILRGTIGLYCDTAGRAVPVEITLPGDFLAAASTNPDDQAARRARRPVPVGAVSAPEEPVAADPWGPSTW